MRRASNVAIGALAGCVALGGAVPPGAASAQAVGGRVVEVGSRRPLPGVAVRLLRAAPGDTALPADTTAVAGGATSADGIFLLIAPGTGTYRVRIGDLHMGPVLALAVADSMDQREYQVPAAAPADSVPPNGTPNASLAALVGGTAARVYDEKEVDQKARLDERGSPRIDMREVMESTGRPPVVAIGGTGSSKTRWHAVVEAVVSPEGRAVSGSVRAVSATSREFGAAAERYVRTARFTPAQVGGRAVWQRVRVPVDVMTETRVRVQRF